MGNEGLQVLVLRAWAEPDGEPRLRVRVVQVSPGRADRSLLTTTSVDEACVAVRDWLVQLQQGANRAGDVSVTARRRISPDPFS